jgi:hypothetical protein
MFSRCSIISVYMLTGMNRQGYLPRNRAKHSGATNTRTNKGCSQNFHRCNAPAHLALMQSYAAGVIGSVSVLTVSEDSPAAVTHRHHARCTISVAWHSFEAPCASGSHRRKGCSTLASSGHQLSMRECTVCKAHEAAHKRSNKDNSTTSSR